MEQITKDTHDRRYRSRRKLRAFLKVLGSMGVVVALVMFGLWYRERNQQLLYIGAAYMLLSLVFIVVAKCLDMLSHSKRGRSVGHGRHRPVGGSGGMALVVVVLLLAFLSCLVVYAQTSAVTATKRAGARKLRTNLRIAAADAAWTFVRSSARSALAAHAADLTNVQDRVVLPSGVDTAVSFTSAEQSSVAFPKILGGQAYAGRMFVVEALAAASGATERVHCLVRHNTRGAIEILGWLDGTRGEGR